MERVMRKFACVVAASLASAAPAFAQQVRFYEENGITYRETKEVVRRPVTETRLEDRPRVVYRPQPGTSVQKCYRTVRVPVTEYRSVTRWVGRYNPFVQPYAVEERVPVVRWEYRTEEYNVPLANAPLVAETVTEKVPVQSRRFVDEEVIRRVAVSGPAAGANSTGLAAQLPARESRDVPASDPFARPQTSVVSTPAARTPTAAAPIPIGGVAKMESDPPRQGVNSGWRQAIPVRR
jgi:hypothetical protein